MALDSFRRKEERFHILNFCIKKPEEEEGENTPKLTGKKKNLLNVIIIQIRS